jgi:hypothetical protein
MKKIERPSVRISLLAMFSVLLFLSSILSKITVTYGAIVFNFVLLIGVLVLKLPYSGTILTLITSILYSFVSPLGPLMLGTFLLKGVTLDIFFVVFKVYRDAYNKKYNIPVIVTAIVLSGIFAGLYHYFFHRGFPTPPSRLRGLYRVNYFPGVNNFEHHCRLHCS